MTLCDINATNASKTNEPAGMNVFGSGWVWLVWTHAKGVEIVTTPNQDRPLNAKVIIACDLWEHAYYLRRQNKRNEYITAFFAVVDYRVANERLLKAIAANESKPACNMAVNGEKTCSL